MPYIAITDPEIAAQKPLKSDILARLRDNPQQVLCDPPGSTTLKLRPSQYVMRKYYDFNYRNLFSAVIGYTDAPGELSVVSLECAFNTQSVFLSDPMRSTTAECGLWINATVIYVAGVATAVRFKRRHPPMIASGTGSGTLQTQAFVDIPLTNSWVSIFTLSRSGQTPTIQVRATVVGNEVRCQAQKINAWTGRVWCGWSGYVYGLEYKAP